jgi:hypothetical protein
MVREAQRRRGRRLAQRTVTAGSALAACAAAVAAVVFAGLPGAQQKSVSPAQTIDTAYVTKRVASALSAAGPAEIAQMTVTSSRPGGGTATAREWSYGDQWRSVVYSGAGQPVLDKGGASSTYTLVDYPARTWARQRGVAGLAGPAAQQTGCVHAAAALSLLPRPGIGLSAGSPSASVVQLLHAAISCGTLTGAGRQRVDGIEATKLTSSSGSRISETIWVNPATYLPVRVVIRSAAGSPVVPRTADITWLKPTAQNRAALIVSIPAGFREVPSEVSPGTPGNWARMASTTAMCPPLVVGRSPWWASSAVALLRAAS